MKVPARPDQIADTMTQYSVLLAALLLTQPEHEFSVTRADHEGLGIGRGALNVVRTSERLTVRLEAPSSDVIPGVVYVETPDDPLDRLSGIIAAMRDAAHAEMDAHDEIDRTANMKATKKAAKRKATVAE